MVERRVEYGSPNIATAYGNPANQYWPGEKVQGGSKYLPSYAKKNLPTKKQLEKIEVMMKRGWVKDTEVRTTKYIVLSHPKQRLKVFLGRAGAVRLGTKASKTWPASPNCLLTVFGSDYGLKVAKAIYKKDFKLVKKGEA